MELKMKQQEMNFSRKEEIAKRNINADTEEYNRVRKNTV